VLDGRTDNHLNVADSEVFAAVAPGQVPHDVLVVVLQDPHDDVRRRDALGALRLLELPNGFHLHKTQVSGIDSPRLIVRIRRRLVDAAGRFRGPNEFVDIVGSSTRVSISETVQIVLVWLHVPTSPSIVCPNLLHELTHTHGSAS
jgi:hypothetical protein